MANSQLHQKLAAQAWSECRQIFAFPAPLSYKTRFQEPEWRQAFQFLTVALFYSWHAILKFPDDKLHVPLVPTPAAWETILPGKTEIPALDDPDLGELFGSSHFASSSFRISSGLLKVHRLSAISRFLKAERGDDWDRKSLEQFLDKLPALGCCNSEWSMIKPEEVAALRLTIILAHRDNFGHGEDPDLRGKWSQERQQRLRGLYRCRVAEVQLTLVGWGLSQLRRWER